MSPYTSAGESDTIALGRALGRRLRAGDVVLLRGPLGAGKTALVRGLAEGLGADASLVSSPTFALVQVYRGRVPLQHVDLYRVDPADVDDLGLDELRESAVMAVEWPDRWQQAPADAIVVTIERVSESSRRVTMAPDLIPPGSWALPS